MRIIILIVFSLGLFLPRIRAQVSFDTQDPQWQKEYDQSMALAVKLFPDLAVKDSQLHVMMEKVFYVWGKNNSQILKLSTYPLILAAEAASLNKTEPHWDSVTAAEQREIYNDLTTGLLLAHDSSVSEARAVVREDPAHVSAAHPAALSAPSVLGQIKPSRKGYIYFYNYLSNQSHWTSSNHAAAKAIGGPFDQMTWGEAQNEAQKQWQALSTDDQLVYEQKAQMYGSGPDPVAPSVNGNYDVNITTDPDR